MFIIIIEGLAARVKKKRISRTIQTSLLYINSRIIHDYLE